MQTKTKLTLEQTQQGVSDEVLNMRVIPHSIHSDDGNPTSANIKQALRQNELSAILRFGKDELFNEERNDDENKKRLLSMDIDGIFERAETVEQKGAKEEAKHHTSLGSNLANNEDSAVELKKLKKEMKTIEVALLGVARPHGVDYVVDSLHIRHLEELHVTWAHLEKKQTRLRTYTNITQDNVLSSWRRYHQYNVTPSQQRPRRPHSISRRRQCTRPNPLSRIFLVRLAAVKDEFRA
ncbi:hypothetical protein Tco_1166594 [Tanacetum coccineum]